MYNFHIFSDEEEKFENAASVKGTLVKKLFKKEILHGWLHQRLRFSSLDSSTAVERELKINRMWVRILPGADLFYFLSPFLFSQPHLVRYRDRVQQMTILDLRPQARRTLLWVS